MLRPRMLRAATFYITINLYYCMLDVDFTNKPMVDVDVAINTPTLNVDITIRMLNCCCVVHVCTYHVQ